MNRSPHYQPYYCEENVWHLAREADARGISDPHAVFISNEHRSVALWSQRAADDPRKPTLWDYHVVLVGRHGGQWKVFDLDCTVGFELDLQNWVAASFPFAGAVPPDVAPRFRAVDATTFLAEFRTDRSHMREDDRWKAAPPPWAPLHEDFNLWDFVDPDGDAPGEVFDLDAFLDAFS